MIFIHSSTTSSKTHDARTTSSKIQHALMLLLCACTLSASAPKHRSSAYKDTSYLQQHNKRVNRHMDRVQQWHGGVDASMHDSSSSTRMHDSSSSAQSRDSGFGVRMHDSSSGAHAHHRSGGSGASYRLLPLMSMIALMMPAVADAHVILLQPTCGSIAVIRGTVICGCDAGKHCAPLTAVTTPTSYDCCARACCNTEQQATVEQQVTTTPTPTDPCAMTVPELGAQCQDGSYYVGQHTLTGKKLYIADRDAPRPNVTSPGYDPNGVLRWIYYNSGQPHYVDLPSPITNCNKTLNPDPVGCYANYVYQNCSVVMDPNITGCYNGQEATAYLDNISRTNAAVGIYNGTYPAAQYCANSTALGYDDWYLPSVDEVRTIGSALVSVLNKTSDNVTAVLEALQRPPYNKTAMGLKVNLPYMSSSEWNWRYHLEQSLDISKSPFITFKDSSSHLRCMRTRD